MKISKIITKLIAGCATGVMLFAAVANATTIVPISTTVNKVPNMSGITVPYSNMVNKANVFDSNLSALIVNSFTTTCYSAAAIDAAIANANNAITSLKAIVFYSANNTKLPFLTAINDTGAVRDNGQVAVASNYLTAAQLLNAVQFSLSTGKSAKFPSAKVSTDEYYDTLTFKYSLPLYSFGVTMTISQNNSNGNYYLNVDNSSASNFSISSVVDKLNQYIDLLNAVKAFDQAAGCFDVTVNPPATTTTTTTSMNKPGKPGNTTTKPAKPATTKDAVITVQYSQIKQGTKFIMMDGVKAMDNGGKGPDITKKVTIKGTINTAKLGTYTITYSVKGANGKTVTKTVSYQVVKDINQGGRHYDRR